MVKLSKTDLWNPQNSDVFTGKPYWKLLFNLFVSLSAILLKTDFLKEFSLHDFCKIAFFKISLRFPSNKAADLKSFGCTFTENDVLVKNLKNYILARLITVGKVAKYGVFSGPYFPSFGQNTDQRKRRIWTLLSQCILCKKYIWILKFMSIPLSKFPKSGPPKVSYGSGHWETLLNIIVLRIWKSNGKLLKIKAKSLKNTCGRTPSSPLQIFSRISLRF